ncbi:hypothetical protein FBEOM_6578 [Fusarium beomiforme]|uniref:Uncharacterized protein n=1 Tax=Fusarium beomiforme TaxID=44412 RepID=A0A9P5AIU5_9HYPO|nr:hypothetical protein FBEOM_6578 [Fusarium beomiforme]
MSTPDVKQADADLWLAYGIKLKNALSQSPTLGSGTRFYIAPLSAAGIAAGRNIDEAIKNNGVYSVGDTLLDLDHPVFLPSRQSYFQRCLSYCGSVDLQSDKNPGAVFRYHSAQEDEKDALKDFTDVKKAALAAYKDDKVAGLITDPFAVWVIQNYPEYAQAQQKNNSATAACAAAAAEMDGPQAAMVGRYLSALTAADGPVVIDGYTMACSTASADQIGAGQAGTAVGTFAMPAYMTDPQYGGIVDGWIATYPQNKKNPKTFTFTTSDASKSSWSELGYSESDVEVTDYYCCFFSVTYYEHDETVTKNFSAEEYKSEMEITITATDIGTFKIEPGKWNPGELAGMPIVDNADPNLKKPMAFIDKAVLAYGVGMTIKLSSSSCSTISNYLEKASSTGGYATLFGFNIGLGGNDSYQTSTTTFDQVKSASSSTTITIPPSDNAYPTLLAAFGQSIPLPSNI